MEVKLRLKCLDYFYDKDAGFLNLLNLNLDTNERRVFTFSKDDLEFNGQPASDAQIVETAKMWKGKDWTHIMQDDPKASLNDEDAKMHEEAYMGKIGEKLDLAAEEMSSQDYIVEQRKKKLMEKEIKRKLDAIE